MMARLGEIEIVDQNVTPLVVDDERGRPVLLQHRLGDGEVYFLNVWEFPGALNADDGPGARLDSKGLIGTIYQYLAEASRGNVWISEAETSSGEDCEYIAYSYFPESGDICLQNVDFECPRCCTLHVDGVPEHIQLEPAELRILRGQTNRSVACGQTTSNAKFE